MISTSCILKVRLIYSVSVYKKHLYKKRLVEFSKIKKHQLVDFRGHKKRVSQVHLMKFDKKETLTQKSVKDKQKMAKGNEIFVQNDF